MFKRTFIALPAVLCLGACPQTESPPGPDIAAAYLGLGVGKTFTYDAGSGLNEKIEITQSSLVVDDKLVFDLRASRNGFPLDERTFTVVIGAEDVTIARFLDCVAQCRQPDEPVSFLSIPLEAGQTLDSSVELDVSRNGVAESTASERHTLVVGGLADVTVPAGTFSAFSVSWTRTRDGQSASSLLKIAPETGIVSWQGFDGASLALTE